MLACELASLRCCYFLCHHLCSLWQGMLRMVVNISPSAAAYDETSHVLNFSAAARKVPSLASSRCLATWLSWPSVRYRVRA